MPRNHRYITNLSAEQLQELEDGYKYGENNLFRMHCQAILLSYRGYTVQALMQLFDCRKNTIYDWFNRYEQQGIEGLRIKPGRGRKPKLQDADRAVVEAKIQEHPRKLSLAKAAIEKQLGKSLSCMTLRRFLKKLTTHGVAFVAASKTGKTPRRWQKSRKRLAC